MFSPPPKAGRFNPPAPRRPFYRRSRFIYLALFLLLLYIWITPPSFLHKAPIHAPSLRYKNVDWSLYAYSSFATSTAYLCNSVMLFEALSRLGSKADRILFYPETWDLQVSNSRDRDSQLLVKAQEDYGVKLIPMDMYKAGNGNWNVSFARFLAWDQSQYDRVMHLDSDMTMYKHLDELFMLPSAQVAMARAYWALPEKKALSSKLVLVEPSHSEYERLLERASDVQKLGEIFDMDELNGTYDGSALVLPHLRYGLTSGEFRSENHEKYLGRSGAVWDPEWVMKEASLIHFLDSPLPKPWIMWPRNLMAELVPPCRILEGGKEDCRDKEIWLGLYDDFRQRRKVCSHNFSQFCQIHLADDCRKSVGFCLCLLQNGHHLRKETVQKVILKTSLNS